MIFRLLPFFVLGLLAGPLRADENQEPLIFAAASLTNVMNDIAADYKRETGAKVRLSFASSAILARQIEFGAPAALFISANRRWVDYLGDRATLAPDSPVKIAGNRLVLIAQTDLNAEPDISFTDALSRLGANRLAMAAPDTVPAGIHARQALEALGLWKALEKQIAPAANVRSALALVESGAAPYGIVYATDAYISTRVSLIAAVPAELHSPIEYWAVIMKQNDGKKARQFLKFLQSGASKLRFQAYGFSTEDNGPGLNPETGQQ